MSPDQIRTFVGEALLMRSFQHDNVLSLIGISFDVQSQPIVILPFLKNGDLLSYLRNPKNVSLPPSSIMST